MAKKKAAKKKAAPRRREKRTPKPGTKAWRTLMERIERERVQAQREEAQKAEDARIARENMQRDAREAVKGIVREVLDEDRMGGGAAQRIEGLVPGPRIDIRYVERAMDPLDPPGNAVKDGPLTRLIDVAHLEVDGLTQAVEMLTMRLESVTASAPPTNTGNEVAGPVKTMPNVDCKLSSGVASLGNRIAALESRVLSLTNRLQV